MCRDENVSVIITL